MIKSFTPTAAYLLLRMKTDTPLYRTYEVVASGDNGGVVQQGDLVMLDEEVPRRNIEVAGEMLILVRLSTVTGTVVEGD